MNPYDKQRELDDLFRKSAALARALVDSISAIQEQSEAVRGADQDMALRRHFLASHMVWERLQMATPEGMGAPWWIPKNGWGACILEPADPQK